MQPNLLELAIQHLRSIPAVNERANIRKAQELIMEFYGKLPKAKNRIWCIESSLINTR